MIHGFKYTEGVMPEVNLSLKPHKGGSFCDKKDEVAYEDTEGNLIVYEGYHFYLYENRAHSWDCGVVAEFIIPPLCIGLMKLKREPENFTHLDPVNGWGSYASFVPWVEQCLSACCQYPEALVSVSRQ